MAKKHHIWVLPDSRIPRIFAAGTNNNKVEYDSYDTYNNRGASASAAGYDARLCICLYDEARYVCATAEVVVGLCFGRDGGSIGMVIAHPGYGDGGWAWSVVGGSCCGGFSSGHWLSAGYRRVYSPSPYWHRQARGRQVSPVQDCYACLCGDYPQSARRHGGGCSLCRCREWRVIHLFGQCRHGSVGHSHPEHPRGCHHLHAHEGGG